jgi:hypothetical protein
MGSKYITATIEVAKSAKEVFHAYPLAGVSQPRGKSNPTTLSYNP